jgi:DNA replication protein DnaC
LEVSFDIKTFVMRREEDWKRVKTSYLKKLTPRIQRDLTQIIEPPKELPSVIESTFITGKVKTGKTILAAFMLLQEAKNVWLSAESKEGLYQNSIIDFEFIPVVNLLDKIRSTFNTSSNCTRQELIDYYSNVHLLVLDDLGVYKTTDYVLETLYLIINNRYEFLKKTIITSNFSLKELSSISGDDRIFSRIESMCRIIHMSKKY